MTIDEKLDAIMKALERIENRQVGFQEIMPSAPPGSFASTSGREQAIALTKLDEVLMWTNIAIARNE
jgi:hypothetical protein